jgi:hypothetical protein
VRGMQHPGIMRYLLALLMVVLVAAPATAKPHKRHRRPLPAKVRRVPNDAAAKQSAMAEAQLAELRDARELPAPAAEPQVSAHWVPQENDAEVPRGLRAGK